MFLKDIIDDKKWENEYFFETWFDPKECWIFFKRHFEKLSKSILLFIRLKREYQQITDEKEYSHTQKF